MRIIKCISEYIEEEIADGEKYIEKALEVKEDYPQLAQTFYSLSIEEMKHSSILHTEVVKLIEEYKREQGEPPKEMMFLYEYLHNKYIDQARNVKVLQAMFNE